MIKTAVYPLC